jgi:aryl-alcohol dehydrogenase-like predicted oxidoreductase
MQVYTYHLIGDSSLNAITAFSLSLAMFQPENLEHNQIVFERVNEVATRKGCTSSQLASTAWPGFITKGLLMCACPIPGTTKIENFY